jgi:hypothetical protein
VLRRRRSLTLASSVTIGGKLAQGETASDVQTTTPVAASALPFPPTPHLIVLAFGAAEPCPITPTTPVSVYPIWLINGHPTRGCAAVLQVGLTQTR